MQKLCLVVLVLELSLHLVTKALGEKQIKAAVLLMRHGARGELPKDDYGVEIPQENQQETHISVVGSLQVERVAAALRSRYANLLTDGDSPVEAVDKVQIRSTDTARTLESAQVFITNFLKHTPTQFTANANETVKATRVFAPVHSTPLYQDILLRGAMNCPLQHEYHVNNLIDSDKFYDKEQETVSFRTQIGTSLKLTSDDVRLSRWYNIYDMLNKEPGLASKLSNHQLEGIQDLANWLEYQKYGNGVSRNFGSSSLWLQTRRFLEHFQYTREDPRNVFVASAHYATQISFAAVMGVFMKEIPPFASVLAVELYKENDNGKYTVSVMLHRQKNNATVYDTPVESVVLPFTDEHICFGKSECSLRDAFHRTDRKKLVDDTKSWCKTCLPRLTTRSCPVEEDSRKSLPFTGSVLGYNWNGIAKYSDEYYSTKPRIGFYHLYGQEPGGSNSMGSFGIFFIGAAVGVCLLSLLLCPILFWRVHSSKSAEMTAFTPGAPHNIAQQNSTTTSGGGTLSKISGGVAMV